MNGRVHFIGIGGAGMSALALVLARTGAIVSGSDRDHDRGCNESLFQVLASAGVTLHPQDGSGVPSVAGAEVVVSGAVEESVSDLAVARGAGIKVRHRAEVLAALVNRGRGVAVAGTSGKSTVAAMSAWLLREAGMDPSFLGGAPLAPGMAIGDGVWPSPAAWAGASDLIVAEADESDGSVVRYRPEVGVITNLTEDHHPLLELREMLRTFAAATTGRVILHAERAEAGEMTTRDGVARTLFGFSSRADVRPDSIDLTPNGSTFSVQGASFRLRSPGRFNVENALAALAVARHFDVADVVSSRALAAFPGLSRRMERMGTAGGVEVIDDFAHNPDKVTAALQALALSKRRLRVLFQLHGFGPARMHREGLVGAFAAGLRPGDLLFLPPIYYAGGTAVRDVSAGDYLQDLRAAGVDARPVERDAELPRTIAGACRRGDRVVIMGARDPSLPDLARAILGVLGRADLAAGA